MIGVLRRLWPCLLLVGACTDDSYVIDPFPVSVSFANGVPQLQGCTPELSPCTGTPLTVVIDTGTPVTVVDPGTAGSEDLTRQHTSLDLESMGATGPVTRARFTGFTAFVQKLGAIGVDDLGTVQPGVVLGGDLLQSLAMRLDPNAGKLYFFPDIAGESEVLARECSAVIPTARLGGGEYVFEGSEISFAPTRLVVGTCMNLDGNPPTTDPEPRRPKGLGADALLVVSTGLPVTVLSESAWLRACAVEEAAGNAGACSATTESTLHIPGTAPDTGITVKRGTLRWLGISADEVQERRGPCKEMWASRMMDLGGCLDEEKAAGTCLCVQGSDTNPCRAGASAEVAGPIEVAIIDDQSPLLQGLRDELRPGVADIDGLLGMNALRPFVTDFDYPGSRLIFRCEGAATGCVVRPRLQSYEVRRSLTRCLGGQNFTPTPAEQIPR